LKVHKLLYKITVATLKKTTVLNVTLQNYH